VLKPVCPLCRKTAAGDWPLTLRTVAGEKDDTVVEGILTCSNRACLSEYPIIDGIPIIVADLRSYISQSIFSILARDDLDDATQSLLGDCCGQGSAFDTQRQYLSTYGFDHYGDYDTGPSKPADVLPGSVQKVLQTGLSHMGGSIRGPIIDMGCSVGRTSFELAAHFDEIVLGVDLNFGMLKVAQTLMRKGRVRYPKRRVGLVYETRDFPAVFHNSVNVDFWACDVTCLPFPSAGFGFGVCINTIDCVSSPYDHLKELARALKPDGGAIATTPYDWNANATPVESWIGGHSQRSEKKGSSEEMMRSLLTGGGHPNTITELETRQEIANISWQLRLHDRSSMAYEVHMLILKRLQDA